MAAYLAAAPLRVLSAAQIANLSAAEAARREIVEAGNEVVRQAQQLGQQIPVQSRASRYESPILRIVLNSSKSVEWRAAALAEYRRVEKGKRKETHRVVRRVKRQVATVVAKRKQRAVKRRRGIPEAPHVRTRVHTSDEAAGELGGAGGGASDEE